MVTRIYLPDLVAAARFSKPGEPTIATLDPAKSHHLIRVLRKKERDIVHIFDGFGCAYSAVIIDVNARACVLRVDRLIAEVIDPVTPEIHIGHALCAAAKMDWLVEKCTELGMHSFTPLASEKSQAKQVSARQQGRWRRLMVSACEQSGRNWLPLLHPLQKLADYAAATPTPTKTKRILLSPSATTPLQKIIPRPSALAQIYLLIGPESGFAAGEEQALTQLGFQPATLNAATLRAETACLTALALLNHPAN